jgi:hypothetical protein
MLCSWPSLRTLDTLVVTADGKLFKALEGTPYAHLAHPLTDAAILTPSTNCRAPMYCNPYCNRADRHWYTMDKAILPDHQKPPKQAQSPDA